MGKVSMHPCEVCSTSFARKGDLTRHSYIHEDIKPYKCKICNKGFSQSSGLKTHMNTHSGNKPYWCSFGCASRFGDPSSCARHEKEIHRRKIPYQCPEPYCSSRIKRRSSFADHLKSKHGINADGAYIDACAPPLSPLTKQRRPRGKSLKLNTDTTVTDEFKEQALDDNSGLSSAGSETASPVEVLPRSSWSHDIQGPLYSEDFFGTKLSCALDSPVVVPTPEQFVQHFIWPPFPLSTGAKFEPLPTPSVGQSFNPFQDAHASATRDVASDVYFSFGFRGRGDFSDYSFPNSVKSWC